MSVTSGFFNSINNDRLYDAKQMAEIFDGIINDGVYQSIGQRFMVNYAGNGMAVTIGSGRAWFNHTWCKNDNAFVMMLDQGEAVLNRIDTIAIKVDHNNEVRDTNIVLVKGTPAVNPAAPTLTDTANVFWHPIANIYVGKGATTISQSNISYRVGIDSRTPYVTGILQVLSIANIVAQWQAEFSEWEQAEKNDIMRWYENLHNQLDENQAIHLQFEIDDLLDRLKLDNVFNLVCPAVASYSANGVNVQSNGDGTITLSGRNTAGGDSTVWWNLFESSWGAPSNKKYLANGKYKLYGYGFGGNLGATNNITAYLQVYGKRSTSASDVVILANTKSSETSVEFEVTDSYPVIGVRLVVTGGASVSGKIKPMITTKSTPAPTAFIPGAMSNQALTAKVNGLENSGNSNATAIANLQTVVNNLWKTLYPVGSILINTSGTNPATYLGGTWIEWGSGRVPVGVNSRDDDFKSANQTGGAKKVRLRSTQVPLREHFHKVREHTHEIRGFQSVLTDSSDSIAGSAAWLQFQPDGNLVIYSRYEKQEGTDNPKVLWQSGTNQDYRVNEPDSDYGSFSTRGRMSTESAPKEGAWNSKTEYEGYPSDPINPHTSYNASEDVSLLQPYVTCYMWMRTA